jgi:UDPglucose--hexose-1-phosphate uridylyltransferase
MPYNELRKDYLLNRWVVIATDRGKRPTDLAKPRPETNKPKPTVCPLCAGNESMTPPAVMLYQKSGSKISRAQDPQQGERLKDWLVRAIPNLYPAFTPPKQQQDASLIFQREDFANAIGHHEVLVESPNHDEDPADTTLPQLELVINAYIDRFNELSSKPYVKYVSIFRNFGLEAGASLSHAHSQIIATPMVPSIVIEEQQAANIYHKKNGRCAFCDIIERERNGPRFIFENNHFEVFTPYASVNLMEFWILPKSHTANISDLTQSEVKALAESLKNGLSALKTVVNDPPYNYGIHQTLAIDGNYHWHIEVYPKLSTWAGFEKNTGIYINTVTPEAAAESLRKAFVH